MQALGHAVSSANALNHFVHSEIQRPDNNVQSDGEKAENEAARVKALGVLRRTICIVDDTLAHLRSTRGAARDIRRRAKPTTTVQSIVALENQNVEAQLRHNLLNLASSSHPSVDSLKEAMSADKDKGLGSQVGTLKEMATCIGPIIKAFDTVLEKPYLEKYSASLNTVPVVGLKNNKIMYLASHVASPAGDTRNAAQSDIEQRWEVFSDLPSGANLSETARVHLFPFEGDLCISVGRAAWRKKHVSEKSDAVKDAVDHWPKLYENAWEKIGDNALPAADLRSVIPFAVLAADREELKFKLLVLMSDNTMKIMMNDTFVDANTWRDVAYTADGDNAPQQAPSWNSMAYWNNGIVAIDEEHNFWEVTVDFATNTYTAAGKSQLDPVSEFTATENGPVAVHDDGFLYQRYIEQPPADGSDPRLSWVKQVALDGVTNLGVASPGVTLDLRLLTSKLRSDYIGTQSSLYSLVNRILSFARTHKFYLSQLAKAADQWAQAPDGDKKQDEAIKQGKRFVTHLKYGTKIIRNTAEHIKEQVNINAKKLKEVQSQLEVQLQVLQDTLTGLENTLKDEKERLSKLQAAFWGSVISTILGIGIEVLSLAIGGPLAAGGALLGGALFAAGLGCSIAFGLQMTELIKEVSINESQAESVKTSQKELSSITDKFTDLADMYTKINEFWGGVFDNADQLQDMDDITAAQLGDNLLGDPTSIEAAQEVTTEILNSCNVYLDTLNKQGIQIKAPNQTVITSLLLQPLQRDHFSFDDEAERARELLSQGDIDGYERYLKKADIMNMVQLASMVRDQMRLGKWFDLAALSHAAQIWSGDAYRPSTFAIKVEIDVPMPDLSNLIDRFTTIRCLLRAAAPGVLGMLTKVVDMSKSTQSLVQEYKRLSTANDQAAVTKLKDTLLSDAMQQCRSARSYAAQANNHMVQANHEATDYYSHLKEGQNMLADSLKLMNEKCKPENWPGVITALDSVVPALYKKRDDIAQECQYLQDLEKSGNVFQGHAMTWKDMVQTVSCYLGHIYDTLSAVQDQVTEDPTFYDELTKTEWKRIHEDANTVKDMLIAHGSHTGAAGQMVILAGLGEALTSRQVVQTLCPIELQPKLRKQAEDARKFFSQIERLQKLPYLSDIIGCWDTQQRNGTTLQDVVSKIKLQYMGMMSQLCRVIRKIRFMAMMQKASAKMVLQSKLRLDTWIARSFKEAQEIQGQLQITERAFRDAPTSYQTTLRQIKHNMRDVKEKIENMDGNIDKLDKQRREAQDKSIADVISFAFATSALIASLGTASDVISAVLLAGGGVKEISEKIQIVLDDLKAPDLTKVINALKSSKTSLDSLLHGMENIKPLLVEVVEGVNSLGATVENMVGELATLKQSVKQSKVSLSESDCLKTEGAWDNIHDACTKWKTVINGQGFLDTDEH